MTVRILVLLLASFFMVSCDNEVTLEQEALKTEQRLPETAEESFLRQRKQEKIAGDFLDLTLSDNPKAAQALTHPDFTFNFRGLKQDQNVAYDRDAYFDSWIQNFAGVPSSCRFKTTNVTRDLNTPPLIPDGPICLQRRTHVIEDLDKPAVILEVQRSKKNFKYAFVYEFKDGLIHSVTVYDSKREIAPVSEETMGFIYEQGKTIREKRKQTEEELEGITRQLDKLSEEAMERINEF